MRIFIGELSCSIVLESLSRCIYFSFLDSLFSRCSCNTNHIVGTLAAKIGILHKMAASLGIVDLVVALPKKKKNSI